MVSGAVARWFGIMGRLCVGVLRFFSMLRPLKRAADNRGHEMQQIQAEARPRRQTFAATNGRDLRLPHRSI